MSRKRERDDFFVHTAIPEGSLRVSHTLQTWRALHELPGFALARRDHQRTLCAVLWVLMRCTDFKTMTSRPTWAVLTLRSGRSRSTIARALVTLREWGLIGHVAPGRSAAYSTLDENGQRRADAAVYVLTRPAGRGLRDLPVLPEHAAEVERREALEGVPGDEKETPPASAVPTYSGKETYARAKETTQAAPLRGRPFSRHGADAVQPHHPARREVIHYPAHQTMASDVARVAGLSTLRNLVVGLRDFSVRDLRSLTRPFLEAGWTIADLRHALEALPHPDPRTGQQRWAPLPTPDPSAHPTREHIRLRELVRARLERWITPTGEVMRSHDQRLLAHGAALRAEARASHERRKRSHTNHPQAAAAAQAGIARVRAALATARGASEQGQKPLEA